ESHEGRPTKIEGNELHPATRGASSTRIQSAILDLYDPDRSQTVLEKNAPKAWSDLVAAWTTLAAAHVADGGAGLGVLSRSFASPTLARLRGALGRRFPRMRWATYEPVSDENTLRGVKDATGRDLLPRLRLERSEVILALDADPLLDDPESVA